MSKTKKEKTREKIEEFGGKVRRKDSSGIDKKSLTELFFKEAKKAKDEKENYVWFISGLCLAIFGSLIANFINEFIMSLDLAKKIQIIFLIILLFCIICWFLYFLYREKSEKSEWMEDSANQLGKTKYIKVGPKFETNKIKK